jgi:hypothetical protein
VSALDGGDSEPVKIQETKGCSLFCVGSVQQPGGNPAASAVTAVGGGTGGVVHCLCVAIKRTVQVYELLKSRQRYRKVSKTFGWGGRIVWMLRRGLSGWGGRIVWMLRIEWVGWKDCVDVED